jgi:glutamate racemase
MNRSLPELRIGITDSGVGGLSVCAEVESRLLQSPVKDDVELLYLNAAIEDDYAYNSMPDRQTKLQAFDRFLSSVQLRYQPDLLFIACNTLSILYQDAHFDHYRHFPIEGIVDTNTHRLLEENARDSGIAFIVFATPTTIEEAVYSERLREHGVPANRIAEQACPGLPDAISNDGSGHQAQELLKAFVPAALKQFKYKPQNVLAFLGCTHYGYQAIRFEEALRARVPKARVLNPNHGAADRIISRMKSKPGKGGLKVRFISRYVIPEVVVDSLSGYIGEKAPATLSSLKNFEHLPELCGELPARVS